ncbi:MAG: GAF domain-containing sensor histidine kinase [Actinobacteria bacterium]|nr:GAF domain-containing sensor histidine kinase [Actinomycetota bacterium]
MPGALSQDNTRKLLDAIMHVGSELDVASVLRRIVSVAADLVGAQYGALGVLDEGRRSLAEFHVVGIDDEVVAAIGDRPQGHGILGVLIVDPRPLRLPDLSRHPDSFGFPAGHPPMRSFLGVPIIIRGQAFGNLYLCDKRGAEGFSDEDEEMAVALAAAAAVAIDNARLHAQVRDLALAEDRERIARDLHDTVIQRVFAVGLSLQGVAQQVAAEPFKERIDEAIDELDETIREVRSAIFELNAARRSRRTLRESIASLAAESGRLLGFEPAVQISGPVDTAVDGERAEHVLAVAREALSNIVRHADATKAAISLSVDGDGLCLEVIDDGVGVAGEVLGGHGLANMQARASRFGGVFSVESGAERRTVLSWTVPLPE